MKKEEGPDKLFLFLQKNDIQVIDDFPSRLAYFRRIFSMGLPLASSSTSLSR